MMVGAEGITAARDTRAAVGPQKWTLTPTEIVSMPMFVQL
jgi:hypothetical protein